LTRVGAENMVRALSTGSRDFAVQGDSSRTYRL